MSIEAIEAIERYIHKVERGLSVAEIKKRIEDYLRQRDRWHPIKETQPTMSTHYLDFFIRDGKIIKRDKVIPYKDQVP